MFLVVAVAGVSTYVGAQVARDVEMVPTGKGYGVAVEKSNNNNGQGQANGNAKPTGGSQCPNGICYHGGPVMGGTPTIYVIWYGNWSNGPGGSDNRSGQAVINNFLGSLSGTPYEAINKTYSAGGSTISGNLSVGTQVSDSGSQGTSFGDAGVQAIVAAKINSGALPKNSNAVYMVLTS